MQSGITDFHDLFFDMDWMAKKIKMHVSIMQHISTAIILNC